MHSFKRQFEVNMMKNHIHLLISTTLSMIMTFSFYFILEQNRAENFLVQHFVIDVVRDHFLTFRCWLDGRYSTCLFN